MKVTWNTNYLERKYGVRESKTYVESIRSKLTTQTGVRWDSFVANGRYVVVPIIDFSKASAPTEAEFQAIRVHTKEYRRLDDLAREAKLTLRRTAEIAAHLLRTGELRGDVARTGNMAYVIWANSPAREVCHINH